MKKELLYNLRSRAKNNNLDKILNQKLTILKEKRFLDRLIDIYELSMNLKAIKLSGIKKYFGNFIKNAKTDLKYSGSIINCLNGSKNWLINNKHIFKAEPILGKLQANT